MIFRPAFHINPLKMYLQHSIGLNESWDEVQGTLKTTVARTNLILAAQ